MAGVRRSGRIPKRIPILLLGTDTSGRVFSEETQTLVLSLHGAGILSRNKFAPDEVLTLRLPDSGREAEIRLVGKLGEDPRGYVYGVAFRDPQLDFWQMEFPPSADYGHTPKLIHLECCVCNERSSEEQTEIEADVFLASDTVLRYCTACGQTTSWKLATGAAPAPHPKPQFPAAVPAPREASPPPVLPRPGFVLPSPPSSAYASSSVLDEIVAASGFSATPAVTTAVAIQEKPAAPPPPAQEPLPAFSGGGKPNRRRHVRTRVHFTACIRINHLDEELVECDNVSKGGLCFRSRKRYAENETIEVAVPYSPGQPAIFTPARICRVEELPSLHLFRYGVAYG